jgi:hypothetical protein
VLDPTVENVIFPVASEGDKEAVNVGGRAGVEGLLLEIRMSFVPGRTVC